MCVFFEIGTESFYITEMEFAIYEMLLSPVFLENDSVPNKVSVSEKLIKERKLRDEELYFFSIRRGSLGLLENFQRLEPLTNVW
jgi:hypothetical protein